MDIFKGLANKLETRHAQPLTYFILLRLHSISASFLRLQAIILLFSIIPLLRGCLLKLMGIGQRGERIAEAKDRLYSNRVQFQFHSREFKSR
jgi:hypothetical protein